MNLFAIFLEFSITCRIGTKHNDNFCFLSFSAFPNLFWLEMNPYGYLLHWRILLQFFWNFQQWVGWAGTDGNNNFHCLSFLAFSNVFWIEKKPQWSFLIFCIFLLFFWNFQLRVSYERIGTKILIISLCWPPPTYFGLKRSHNGIFF